MTPRLSALAVLATAGLAVALPSSAGAATGPGSTTFQIKGAASTSMKAKGLRVSTVKPATRKGNRVTLPVSGGSVKSFATVRHSGALKFKAGSRSATLKSIEIKLGDKPALSAKLDKKRYTFFTLANVQNTLTVTLTKAVKLDGAILRLTRSGAKRLARKLRVKRIPSGKFGRASIDAFLGTGSSGLQEGPKSGPISNEPPRLYRPATAVDVSAVSVAWSPRDSWVRYISSGEGSGGGATAIGGATPFPAAASSPCPDAPEGNTPRVYTYGFVPAASWYDAPSGVAGIYGTGGVHFAWKLHGINFSVNDPEVELNGSASRLIFRMNGTDATAFADQRTVFANLNLAGQPTSVSLDGKTFTYSNVRAKLAEGTNVFAGFYPPGKEFGCVSVSFTTP